ncbi:hypothetical protein FRX31_016610, partial [Thalictrum thalictroides]
MNSRCSRAISKVWKTFSPLKELLQLGIKWHVGDGMNIQAWTDSWIPQTPQPRENRGLVLDKWPQQYAR